VTPATASRTLVRELERMAIVEARPRVFTYHTTSEWMGRRNGRFAVAGKESFVFSSPPEFKGEDGFLSPEELFVGSVEMCLMLTFAALAEKQKLPIEAYSSEATGTLEHANGELRFTHILVKPTIIVLSADAAPRVLQTLQLAHRSCMIANSIQAEVKVEGTVTPVRAM
jgi:peroxiredoxin-like protein